MKHRQKNTLAYFNAAPHVRLHDHSELPTAVFAAATLQYRQNCGTTNPNEESVSFYTLNHCASIVRQLFTENEPLPEWARDIMQTYTNVMMGQGERMLHYLLSITTREMRHLKSTPTATLWNKMDTLYGPKAVEYVKKICSNGSETTAVELYMKHPVDLPVGVYAKALAYAYHHGSWQSGYGGKAWGLVSDCMVSMLHGNTSMEMMVDTGYTLAHNGGPIFDKGMMYGSFNRDSLLTLLDIQRAGQLLDLMQETNTMSVGKTSDALKGSDLIKTHCPVDKLEQPTIKGYVDWKLVDELRPAKDKADHPFKYQKVVQAQTQAMAKKLGVKKTSTAATIGGKKVKVTGTWQVFPNQVVTVFERAEK